MGVKRTHLSGLGPPSGAAGLPPRPHLPHTHTSHLGFSSPALSWATRPALLWGVLFSEQGEGDGAV